jgi:hypothetical protein
VRFALLYLLQNTGDKKRDGWDYAKFVQLYSRIEVSSSLFCLAHSRHFFPSNRLS